MMSAMTTWMPATTPATSTTAARNKRPPLVLSHKPTALARCSKCRQTCPPAFASKPNATARKPVAIAGKAPDGSRTKVVAKPISPAAAKPLAVASRSTPIAGSDISLSLPRTVSVKVNRVIQPGTTSAQVSLGEYGDGQFGEIDWMDVIGGAVKVVTPIIAKNNPKTATAITTITKPILNIGPSPAAPAPAPAPAPTSAPAKVDAPTWIPPQPADWNDAAYLAVNPDVARGMADGSFQGNGWVHYQAFGIKEGRRTGQNQAATAAAGGGGSSSSMMMLGLAAVGAALMMRKR